MRLCTIGLVATLALALLVAPLATNAQPAMPVIGFLSSQSQDTFTDRVGGFRRGLAETGLAFPNINFSKHWCGFSLDTP